jgi:hypothetical protein
LARITTAFQAKRNLVTLLRTLPNMLPVLYGHPGSIVNDFDQWQWVGEIEWERDEPESLGNRSSNEVYRIIVTLESHVEDDDQEMANARLESRVYDIQNALVANANPLSIDNPVSTRLEPQFLGEGNNANSGRGAILVLSVRVEARK